MKYIADENGHWIPEEEWVPKGMLIIKDIEPYQSMVTGEVITSRSKHREHLKLHGCIEIGNEAPLEYRTVPLSDKSRSDLIRAQVNAMTHDQLRHAVKRDVDRVKWNSRED